MRVENFTENRIRFQVKVFDELFDYTEYLKNLNNFHWHYDYVKLGFKLKDECEDAIKNTLLGNPNADFKKFMANFKTEKLSEGELPQKKKTFATHGYSLSIPRYLNNQPKCMHSKKKMPSQKRIINVFVSTVVPASVSNKELIEKSKEILELVKAWELNGYRVSLNYICPINWCYETAACKPYDFYATIIPLKSPDKILSLKRFSYCFTRAEFFRGLALAESNLNIKNLCGQMFAGSGWAVTTDEDRRKFLTPILERYGGNNTRVLYIDHWTDLDKFKREIKEANND